MTSTQTHERSTTKDWYQTVGVWLGLIIGFGLASAVAIELTHDAWGEVFSEFHEPPTTALRYSAAVLRIDVALAFDLSTRFCQVLLLALPAAAIEVLVVWWVFTAKALAIRKRLYLFEVPTFKGRLPQSLS